MHQDVLLVDRAPDVVASGIASPAGATSRRFKMLDERGVPVPELCGPLRVVLPPDKSVRLDFRCLIPSAEGRYTIHVEPRDFGMAGPTAVAPIRYVRAAPRTTQPPDGFSAIPTIGTLPDCHRSESYISREREGQIRIERFARKRQQVAIPEELVDRMSSAHAQGVRYVYAVDEGYLVLFDHGEWGGGIEWYPKGGAPHHLHASVVPGDFPPQNVRRAMVRNDVVYALQGRTHLVGLGDGQLVAVWREHDHFSLHVITRFRSTPFDWIPEDDGTWLVGTQEGLWSVEPSGEANLVARLPRIPGYWQLARGTDGVIYVGSAHGVLRLTPTWDELPMYMPELLVATGSRQHACWTGEPDRAD